MISQCLAGDFVLYIFFGFMSSLMLIVVSEFVQMIYNWIDDYKGPFNNYICWLVGRICGYEVYKDHQYYKPDMMGMSGSEKIPYDFGLRLSGFGALIGGLIFLYQYFLVSAIIIVIIVSLLFLIRYVRRLHKKIDGHLLNHK